VGLDASLPTESGDEPNSHTSKQERHDNADNSRQVIGEVRGNVPSGIRQRRVSGSDVSTHDLHPLSQSHSAESANHEREDRAAKHHSTENSRNLGSCEIYKEIGHQTRDPTRRNRTKSTASIARPKVKAMPTATAKKPAMNSAISATSGEGGPKPEEAQQWQRGRQQEHQEKALAMTKMMLNDALRYRKEHGGDKAQAEQMRSIIIPDEK